MTPQERIIAAQIAMMRRPHPRIGPDLQQQWYIAAMKRSPRTIAEVVLERGGSAREAAAATEQWSYRGPRERALAVGLTRRRRGRRR